MNRMVTRPSSRQRLENYCLSRRLERPSPTLPHSLLSKELCWSRPRKLWWWSWLDMDQCYNHRWLLRLALCCLGQLHPCDIHLQRLLFHQMALSPWPCYPC